MSIIETSRDQIEIINGRNYFRHIAASSIVAILSNGVTLNRYAEVTIATEEFDHNSVLDRIKVLPNGRFWIGSITIKSVYSSSECSVTFSEPNPSFFEKGYMPDELDSFTAHLVQDAKYAFSKGSVILCQGN